ncbi:MAG: CbtA family protein [Thaumarchaeota archaeon]|nr:CbtA family protein [Nitrososphaerota archaeon]
MKTSLFIAIILVSGAIAGTAHGLVNLVLVEPFLDSAIGIENQNLFDSGEEQATPEFWANYYSYRAWQKGGEILAGAILGTAMGALFGIVYSLSKNMLPGKNAVKKALFLALVMWATLYVIPFAKYPANPPTVGDPETIILRQTLYLAFIAISGLGALGFYQVYKRVNKKTIAFAGYAGLMVAAFIAMPANPDPVNIDSGLLAGFRATSIIGMSSFWGVVALVLGTLWQKLGLDRISHQKYQ